MKRCELISVAGQIDSATAPELDRTLQGLLAQGKRNLVLNLRETTFVSSAGLRGFVAAAIKARRMIPRGEVVFSEVPPSLVETFDVVGMRHLFKFFDSDVEAVGGF
jgi:anti-anti-sigma factor